MYKKKRLMYVFIILISIITFAGCGNQSNDSSNRDESNESTEENNDIGGGSVFTVAMDLMPEDLIPGWGNDSKTIITRPIYDPLFDEVEEGIEYKIVDDLQKSEDGLTYTIHIADDATWSDGENITTEDIEFSIRYNEYVNGGSSNYSSYDDEPIELKAIDEQTFEWKLPKPKNLFVYNLANFKLIPSHPFEGDETQVDDSGYFMEAGMATSGAYEVSEINADNIVYTARNDYHRGTPETQTVVMKLLGSGATRNVALENEEISYVRAITGEDLDNYSDNESYNTYSIPEGRTNYLTVNVKGPTMNKLDKDAREAIFLALSQEEIIDVAYGSTELAEPANSILTPQQSLYDSEAPGYSQNIEKATELAESSGLTEETLTYVYNQDRANMEQIATVVQQQLAAIGVDVQIEAVDNTTFFGKFWTGDEDERTSWDLGTNGWDSMRGSSLVQPAFYLNDQEAWGWSDEIVELTNATNAEPDRDKEVEMAKELQTEFLDDYIIYPLTYTNFVAITPANVSGLDAVPIVPEFGDYLPITVE